MTPLARKSMATIFKEVASKHGMTIEELREPNRTPRFCAARHEAMALAYAAGYSTPQIGRHIQRDHSTVHHGIQRHKERLLQQEQEKALA